MRLFKLIFFLIFLVYPLGQLARVPITIPSLNFYLLDGFVGLLIFTWPAWHFIKKKKFIWPALTKPILLFSGIAFLSWLINLPGHSLQESLIAFLYLLRWLAYVGLYFVIYEFKDQFGKDLTNGLMAAGLASLVFGFLQYFFLPDTRFLFYSGWDEHYYRLIGTFLDPGYTGLIFVLTFLLIMEKFWQRKAYLLPFAAATYLGLALTYSRASYLAFIFALGLWSYLKKRPRIFALGLVLMVVTLYFLPRPVGEGGKLGRVSTIASRLNSYQKAIRIAFDHPIFGVGFNFYRYVQRDYGYLDDDWQPSHAGAGADASLLFVWATTGTLGLLAFFNLLLKMTSKVPVVLLTVLVHSFFNHSLFYSWVMLWFWMMVALKENK